MRWQILATSAALLLSAQAGAADPAWPTLAKVGLPGTWAASCGDPPSTTNWRMTFFKATDGSARIRADRGSQEKILHTTIDSALLLTPTTVRIRQRYDDPNWGSQNGFTHDVVIEVANGKSRSLQSTRGDGAQLIKDGRFVSNGQPTLTLQKCPN